MPSDVMTLDVKGIISGKRLAVSQALSFVENSPDLNLELLDELFDYMGNAYRIGITGPPGAGKSSLVDHLIDQWRSLDRKVGVISVDPTSPFTGGAILGDRVRMSRHYTDKNVFIRSMASRGSHGGLALRAQEAADILDAAGFDIIIYETVGVGQVELDVAQAADTTIVVLVPESGDDIQAMKAGLMEIADIFVVNKADRQGANQAYAQLRSMLEMRLESKEEWLIPVLKTSATEKTGIEELVESILKHHDIIQKNNVLKTNYQHRLELKIKAAAEEKLHSEFWTTERIEFLDSALKKAVDKQTKPGEIFRALIEF